MEFKKYGKIRLIGNEENKDIFKDKKDTIFIQEKIDGANFRFYINKKGQIIFGSRTQQLTSNEGEDTNVEKNFRRCVEHIRNKWEEVRDISPDKSALNLSHLIFYGECISKHTFNYDWEKIPAYLGFDIYDMKKGKYLNYKDIKMIFCENLKLDIVPLIKICKAKEITKIDDNSVPESVYALISSEDKQAEGICFKNYDKQIFAKYVREKFKEKNKEVFGGGKKWAKTDDEYFCAVYCTNARIDKCIFKLIDEGKELNMTMMGELLNFVYKDIWEENWNEISFSKKKIDLLNLKKLVSKRVLEVLKQAIVNNSLK